MVRGRIIWRCVRGLWVNGERGERLEEELSVIGKIDEKEKVVKRGWKV